MWYCVGHCNAWSSELEFSIQMTVTCLVAASLSGCQWVCAITDYQFGRFCSESTSLSLHIYIYISWWAKHDGHPSGFCHRVLFLMILLTEAHNLLLQTRAKHSVKMFTHNHQQFVLFGELMSKKRTLTLQASFSRILPPTSAVIGYTVGFPKTVGWQYVCHRKLELYQP